MRVVVAPDKFKGSLSAPEAARAMARGVLAADPDAEVDLRPRWPTAARGRSRPWSPRRAARSATSRSPARSASRSARRSACSATARRPSSRWRPRRAWCSSRATVATPRGPRPGGPASCLLAAIDAGRQRVILGIGGSATNDGGAGLGQALGYRLLDADGRDLEPGGGALDRLDRIDAVGARPAARRRRDRRSPATSTTRSAARAGPRPCTAPRRGPTPAMIAELDRNLAHFAAVVERDLGIADPRPSRRGCRRGTRRRARRLRGGPARTGHRARDRAPSTSPSGSEAPTSA